MGSRTNLEGERRPSIGQEEKMALGLHCQLRKWKEAAGGVAISGPGQRAVTQWAAASMQPSFQPIQLKKSR